MKTPTTNTPRSAGKAPKHLVTGGVHLALWPCFNKWVKQAERAAAWQTIEHKEKFFVNLAAVACSGIGAPSAFSYCFQIHRAFTVAALVPLVKRADELSNEHRRAYCYNPSPLRKVKATLEKRREAARKASAQSSRRQDAREAAEAFSQLRTKKRERKPEVKA